MGRLPMWVAIATTLMGLGWAVGKAQTSQPDFELIVNAPVGETRVVCRRGCELLWIERGLNPNAARETTFTFSCTSATQRCSSSRIGGWIKP